MADKPERALVVEDDPNTASMLEMYLEKAGYRVEIVDKGLLAIEKIRKGPPQLVVTDWGLVDGPTGMDVITSARNAGIATIMITGNPAQAVEKLKAMGADTPVISKPFSEESLLLENIEKANRIANSPRPPSGPQLKRTA